MILTILAYISRLLNLFRLHYKKKLDGLALTGMGICIANSAYAGLPDDVFTNE